MTRKHVKPARKNLGLRATPDRLTQLRQLAERNKTSLQGIFDKWFDALLDGQSGTPDAQETGSTMGLWSELFLRALPGAVVIKRAEDLSIVWVNDGYAAWVGESREALHGRRVGQIWATRESAQTIEERDRQALADECATVEVDDVKDRFGQRIKRLRVRFPIHDKSGNKEYLGAIGFDCEKIHSKLRSQEHEKQE
jgi:hypothetical protein